MNHIYIDVNVLASLSFYLHSFFKIFYVWILEQNGGQTWSNTSMVYFTREYMNLKYWIWFYLRLGEFSMGVDWREISCLHGCQDISPLSYRFQVFLCGMANNTYYVNYFSMLLCTLYWINNVLLKTVFVTKVRKGILSYVWYKFILFWLC